MLFHSYLNTCYVLRVAICTELLLAILFNFDRSMCYSLMDTGGATCHPSKTVTILMVVL